MALSRDLALTPDHVDELITTQWNQRVPALGPGVRIHLTPMWSGIVVLIGMLGQSCEYRNGSGAPC